MFSCAFWFNYAPSTFMQLINEVIRPFLRHFVVKYLKGILVYRANEEEHLNHLCQVFDVLRKPSIFVKIEKCSFMMSEILFFRIHCFC